MGDLDSVDAMNSGGEMSPSPTFVVFSMAMHHLEHSTALTVCKFRQLLCTTMQQGGVAWAAFGGVGNLCRISGGMYRIHSHCIVQHLPVL